MYWKESKAFLKFQEFVKDVKVVNNCSERAVKLIQENVEKAKSENKLQDLLMAKNSWKKPNCRTKKSYVILATFQKPAILPNRRFPKENLIFFR